MNVLITGGSGFIGSHITDQCIEQGYKVRILDIKEPHRSDVEFIEGSVVDRSLLKKSMQEIDYVYHLAAISNIDHVKSKPIETIEYNVMGTAYILEEAIKTQIKRFFLASSVFLYEKSGHLYTSSKEYSEILCNNYKSLYDIPYTILRFGTVYGARSRQVDVISIFVSNALKGEKLIIRNNGTQKRNFIYVEDLAMGSVLAMKTNKSLNKVLTISNEKSISIIELSSIVNEIFNNKLEIQITKEKKRYDDYIGNILNISETFSILNWKPQVDIKEGILRYINWYKEHIKLKN